ncbi:MAG: hypothetical protein P4L99_19235, partial [Chthoniobacter sp.]|nr:hypothetical protein [Chthoniobacter sp.]
WKSLSEKLEIVRFFHFNEEDLKFVCVPPLPTQEEIEAIKKEWEAEAEQAKEKKAGAGGKKRRKPAAASEESQAIRAERTGASAEMVPRAEAGGTKATRSVPARAAMEIDGNRT